jgi:hypothetical protein
MIRTVSQLIDALHGTDAAAGTLKTTKKALSSWKVANDLPLWARIEAQRIAHTNGLILDPALVGPKPRIPYGSRTGKTGKKSGAKPKARPRKATLHAAE